jgi:hypothetical protein
LTRFAPDRRGAAWLRRVAEGQGIEPLD